MNSRWDIACENAKGCYKDCSGENMPCFVREEERFTVAEIREYLKCVLSIGYMVERDKSLRNRIAELEDAEYGISAFTKRKNAALTGGAAVP